MAMSRLVDLWAFTLGPSGWAVLLVTAIAVAIPVLLHLYWFSSRTSTTQPSFLLVGPSGAGKTALLTLLERGTPAKTHTSQGPLSVECSLPVSVSAASSRYRSANDPGNNYHRQFLLVDTPGHGKLRNFALDSIVSPRNLKGIIFLVDAAALEGQLSETAAYLHEVLLVLQKKTKQDDFPVLLAANKRDLFTALPTNLVQSALEGEISKLRDTKAKGLLDSGIQLDDGGDEDDRDVLGGRGEGKFEFSLLEEYGVVVEAAGGSVVGSKDGGDVEEYWEWLGRHL